MKGFWKMLSGQGEKEYRQQHKKFQDAIPDRFPFRAGDVVKYGPGDNDIRDVRRGDENLPVHPAYEGPMSRTLEAANYRRANAFHGGKTKVQHREFSEYQRTHDHNGKPIEEEKKGILKWLLGG